MPHLQRVPCAWEVVWRLKMSMRLAIEGSIKVSQAIKPLTARQTIEGIASDRGALLAVPAWATDIGRALKEQFEKNAEYHFVVEKG